MEQITVRDSEQHDSPHARLKRIPLVSVKWTGHFWREQFDRCVAATIPHLLQTMSDPEAGHVLDNLRIAAGLQKGEFQGADWQDEWLYKWIEAVCNAFTITKDEKSIADLGPFIELIGRAQAPDGYIATQIIRHKKRFRYPKNHELYNMGHLITAACAHFRATGKANFLAIAVKTANFLHRFFLPAKLRYVHFPYNPSVIMALVELYRCVGLRKYLDLASHFVDARGSAPNGATMKALPPSMRPIPVSPDMGAVRPEEGCDGNQTLVRLREEDEVIGHSVFWSYLYSGATDVYMESGDDSLLRALRRLWENVTTTKMYITGGVSALHSGLGVRRSNPGPRDYHADVVHEAVGMEYELPPATGKNETCAQIGNFMWNHRMFLIDGNHRYVDVMENTIYNSILSGIGQEGTSWFYSNPLRWFGREHKLLSGDAYERFQPGKRHICCPTNLVRTVAGFHGCAYAMGDDSLYVLFYSSNDLNASLPGGGEISLTQETEYPWKGKVRLRFNKTVERGISLYLSIPSWAAGAEATINGKAVTPEPRAGRFLRLRRAWIKGDVVQLILPMQPRLIRANPRVEASVNQVAVARGPIVYCLESPDLPKNVALSQVRIPRSAKFTPVWDKALGAVALKVRMSVDPDEITDGALYKTLTARPMKSINTRLIPYYLWANRGISSMSVWLPLA